MLLGMFSIMYLLLQFNFIIFILVGISKFWLNSTPKVNCCSWFKLSNPFDTGWLKQKPNVNCFNWFKLFNKLDTSWLNLSPKIKLETEFGKLSTNWLNLTWKVKLIIKFGKLSTDLLKFKLKVKWVKQFGKLSTGWLNSWPKVKWVIEFGKLSTGWLKLFPNVKFNNEFGKLSTSWLKLKPKIKKEIRTENRIKKETDINNNYGIVNKEHKEDRYALGKNFKQIFLLNNLPDEVYTNEEDYKWKLTDVDNVFKNSISHKIEKEYLNNLDNNRRIDENNFRIFGKLKKAKNGKVIDD